MSSNTTPGRLGAANQSALMAELTALSRFLGNLMSDSGNSPSGTSNAISGAISEGLRSAQNDSASSTTGPNESPDRPSSTRFGAMFGLSEFERHIVLLCAGVELDGTFAERCSAAPGSGGNPWPSFGSH